MKPAASVVFLALMAQEPVCDHGSRGPSAPVNLREVERIHAEMAAALDSMSAARPEPFGWPAFESGLPACRAVRTRRHRVDLLPAGMTPLLFAPAGADVPPGALHVVTRARSIRDLPIPADPALAARLGVRCAPTLVRPVSSTEVELAEGDAR